MTDVQAKIPLNGSEVENKKETEVEEAGQEDGNSSNTIAIEFSNDNFDNGPAETKKIKFDGRSKKRFWQFNRRDDSIKRVRTDPEDRVKRRKFIMVLGYAGANYMGMQRNPDVNTIEDELLKALFKNNLITEEAFKQPQYISFQRAARTDKGVSAARQCVSLKLRK